METNGNNNYLDLPIRDSKNFQKKKGFNFAIRQPEDTFGITEEFLSIFPGYGRLLDWNFHGLQEAKWTNSMFDVLNGEEIIEGLAGTFLAKNYHLYEQRGIGRRKKEDLVYSLITLGARGIQSNRQKGYKAERKLAFERTPGLLQITLGMQEKVMNPYSRKVSLRERLDRVTKAELEEFTDSFYKPLHSFVPERDYEKMLKQEKKPSKMTCLHFLPKSPQRGQYGDIYARQIIDLLSQTYQESLEPSRTVSVETSRLSKWYHNPSPPELVELAAKRRIDEAKKV